MIFFHPQIGCQCLEGRRKLLIRSIIYTCTCTNTGHYITHGVAQYLARWAIIDRVLPLESLFPGSEGRPDISASQLHSHCSLQLQDDLLVGDGFARFILVHYLRFLVDSLHGRREGGREGGT